TVTVNGHETQAVTVSQKATAKFDAISIKRNGESPYEFDWNFEGKTTGGNAGANDGYEVEPHGKMESATNYDWPSPEAEHKYERAGTYQASLRLIGDYGTSTFPFTVTVTASAPALAVFAVPNDVFAGQPVTFNATGSKGTPESAVADYAWEFGDGSAVSESQTQLSKPHTFAKPGVYKVKLEITDEVGEKAHVEHEVTVAEPLVTTPPGGGGTGPLGGGQGSGTQANTATTTPTTTKPTVAKALTRSQKLAAALRLCAKIKSKKQRANCERLARNRYAVKKSSKSKKKKPSKGRKR
ncbi:MAG: PKD domain-containing protein, partial [Solirubrobacterales bacterium]|nr:PKD domain-containing protein [Solirubrobacterales bacterium]